MGADKNKAGTGPLVWMDLEMSGLDPQKDLILEMATIVTDGDLNILEEGPNLVIRRPPELFDTMDQWNREHHTKSGLWKSVLKSQVSEEEAEAKTLAFIKKHVKPQTSPLCGNSIWQDRRFLRRYMPSIDNYLHYRMVDVSTLKELCARWYSEDWVFDKNKELHRALDDIKESIDELRYYRERLFLKVGGSSD